MAVAVTELAASFAGRLIQPGDPRFDEARMVHNGMIDKRPALIAQCLGAADIADALQLARTSGREVAIRGGGHNVGGRATVEAGVLIDLSLMRGVHVDPRQRTARVQGGALWRELNRETQLHGLATTGGIVSSTGVSGLTLGGGLGWLMAKYGMALDNLRAVDLVMADGSLARAAADENDDLFWAVRGGGGNFGIASSFEFGLHPVGPMVTGGLIAYPFDRAKDVLRFFRDKTRSLPDDMMMAAALLTGPDGVTKLAAMLVAHVGAPADAEAAVRPIKQFGAPVMDVIGPMPYTALNSMLDANYPRGARNYWKSHFLDRLSDEAIGLLVDCQSRCPSPMGHIVLEHFHGAATRVAPADTAYALRSEGYNLLFLSQWANAADDEACTRWGRESYASVQPFVGAQRYLNYMNDDDRGDATLAAVYGPNVARLRTIKKRYDPDNVFHLNTNIPPA